MLNKDHCAVVTGAGGGMGTALVRMLADHGVRTIAVEVDPARLAAIEGIAGVEPVLLDVSDTAAVNARFVGETVDILVNAAGVLGMTGTLYSVSPASARRIVDVNILGIFNMLSAIVPGMTARNRGHIVNFGSIAGTGPSLGQPIYSASKAAVHSMSANLRLELFGSDVRVTEVMPGRVRTGMHAEMFAGGQAQAEATLYDGFETLDPQDIARTIGFILDMPQHVCISSIEVVPTHQVVGGTKMHRRPEAR